MEYYSAAYIKKAELFIFFMRNDLLKHETKILSGRT